MSSFFDLPPPWNPGYALPSNVRREGLYRSAEVTAQYPRGTYNTQEGAAVTTGYATPGYVRKEMIGQGAAVTKWLPRGTFFTANRPLTALSGVDGEVGGDGTIWKSYGRHAAAYLFQRVQGLPVGDRERAMKVVLDKIDPALWTRAEAEARPFVKMMGPRAALEEGLARAMSKGVVKELEKIGRTRRAPSKKSLTGLGCYGCAAVLGDVLEALGETTSRDHRGETVSTTGHQTTRPPAPGSGNDESIQIGPFSFPVGGTTTRGTYRVHTANLPPTWKKWITDELKRLSKTAKGWRDVGQVTEIQAVNSGLEKWFGMSPTDKVVRQFVDGTAPIIKSTDPIKGNPVGLFIVATPSTLEVWYKDMTPKPSKPWWRRAWDAVKSVGAKIVKGAKAVAEFAKDALEAVADLGCQLVSSPAGQQAGAAAGSTPTPQGQAVAAGVSIAGSLCHKGDEEPVPDAIPVAPPPSSIPILPLAIAGGVVALLLLKKRGAR